jgi:hypothetical protein
MLLPGRFAFSRIPSDAPRLTTGSLTVLAVGFITGGFFFQN